MAILVGAAPSQGWILLLTWAVLTPGTCPSQARSNSSTEGPERSPTLKGRRGGRLLTAQRTEPKTFNPVTAVDTVSREIIDLMNADLVHINRSTLKTEPALAKSWSSSADGRKYTLQLRRGIRFSDGHPMDADDVIFSYRLCLDESNSAPQHDLLIVRGKPIEIRKIDAYAIEFELAAPYAAAERLFDGIAILPRHLLEKAAGEHRLGQTWGINAAAEQIAGLGPFRLKSYVPGQRVVLERNPYYWKADGAGARLPYLDEIVFTLIPNEDTQVIRFLAGETEMITSLSAANFVELKKREHPGQFHTYDAGPGLEYNFLLFNLTGTDKQADAQIRKKQEWFRIPAFRQAVSAAIDREAIVKLAYRGLADPIWGAVPPGNSLWINREIPQPGRSLERARALLRSAGFSWKGTSLVDAKGAPVEFSILTSAGNGQRAEIATIIQDDLRQLGMHVTVVSLEFRTMLDQVFKRLGYEAAVMALASGDADPNSEMNVWLSNGSMHLWNLSGVPGGAWETEVDRLMHLQMTTPGYRERKRLYDRVQSLAWENLPIIPVASPHVLVAATNRLANFRPAALRPYALWNAETLYFRDGLTERQ